MKEEQKSERLYIDLRNMQLNGNGDGRRNTVNFILMLSFYIILALIVGGIIIYAMKFGYLAQLGGGTGGLLLFLKAAKWIKGKGHNGINDP